ncbi:hypothetical protein KKH13_04775 [Patescibacteria group bacterium]|uniref:Uncharacterized protein n=1 Tax=viral metagenome TaxID=1070528 RepID=A0A6M3LNB7_9ZZZZ|nr:hypothetical protein [Patescibacteria group bacterium]
MPTGYTANIEKGITFKEFALGCARAFNACFGMRDEPADKPIPKEFKASTYYEERLKEIRKRLEEVKIMSINDANLEAKKEYADKVEYNQETIGEYNKLREKYTSMLQQVKAWTPPSAEHTEFKNFMKEQIETSIKGDCNTSYYIENAPKLLTGEQWKEKEIKDILWNLDYYSKEDIKEKDRIAGRNLWTKQLRESL